MMMMTLQLSFYDDDCAIERFVLLATVYCFYKYTLQRKSTSWREEHREGYNK